MTTTDRNPIATLLGLDAASDKRAFDFDGHAFQLYPAGANTVETLYTSWADASRNVSAIGSSKDLDLRVANLLAHAFRRGLSRADAETTLTRARAALTAAA